MTKTNWRDFLLLMRLDKPIGILLLLWPMLISLWLAAEGVPSFKNLCIFLAGCVLMRTAGCVINDYADRHFDRHVKRTKDRPITSGRIAPQQALLLFAGLCAVAFVLVLQTNPLTVYLSFGALTLAAVYPFCKRHTHLPQVVLGAAYAFAVPMAWTAERGDLNAQIWLLYAIVVLWTIVYDTFYAMVDRDDDLRIGVKSTAILFGEADRAITGVLQVMIVLGLLLLGQKFALGGMYYSGVAVACLLFAYHQYLIRNRQREACFRAFLHNQWVGCALFVGVALHYALT